MQSLANGVANFGDLLRQRFLQIETSDINFVELGIGMCGGLQASPPTSRSLFMYPADRTRVHLIIQSIIQAEESPFLPRPHPHPHPWCACRRRLTQVVNQVSQAGGGKRKEWLGCDGAPVAVGPLLHKTSTDQKGAGRGKKRAVRRGARILRIEERTKRTFHCGPTSLAPRHTGHNRQAPSLPSQGLGPPPAASPQRPELAMGPTCTRRRPPRQSSAATTGWRWRGGCRCGSRQSTTGRS